MQAVLPDQGKSPFRLSLRLTKSASHALESGAPCSFEKNAAEIRIADFSG